MLVSSITTPISNQKREVKLVTGSVIGYRLQNIGELLSQNVLVQTMQIVRISMYLLCDNIEVYVIYARKAENTNSK